MPLDWKEILSKTSSACEHSSLGACKTCRSVQLHLRPCVLGASIVGFEPEPSVRLYMAKGKPEKLTVLVRFVTSISV